MGVGRQSVQSKGESFVHVLGFSSIANMGQMDFISDGQIPIFVTLALHHLISLISVD